MDTQTIIEKIMQATVLEEVLDIHHISKEYKHLALLVHPDTCSLPLANDATVKLNILKDEFEKRRKNEVLEYFNDIGSCIIKDKVIVQYGDMSMLQQSIDNYNKLMSLRDEASLHFHKYLPKKMEIVGETLHITLEHRSVSLSCLTLSQDHVNWILSRMLEFTAWLESVGYVHCDLNPESILVVPETHGIIISSFFYLTKSNHTLTNISDRYSFWYDPALLSSRKAKSAIDVQLCKKIAIYLLGDPSGIGSSLMTTNNADFMRFVTSPSEEAFDTYESYRTMLKGNFDTKKYYPLYI